MCQCVDVVFLPFSRRTGFAVRAPRRSLGRAGEGRKCPPEQLGRNNPLDDLGLPKVEIRLRGRVACDALWVVVVKVIVGATATQRECVGKGLASAARPANPLLVVEPLRRHVRHHHKLECPDVDPHFHGGSNAEDIDSLRLLDLAVDERALEESLSTALLGQRLRLASKFLDV